MRKKERISIYLILENLVFVLQQKNNVRIAKLSKLNFRLRGSRGYLEKLKNTIHSYKKAMGL